jgi:lipopolysaccharide/colanic/teichoic acid biosynthesis glycosyltransferase
VPVPTVQQEKADMRQKLAAISMIFGPGHVLGRTLMRTIDIVGASVVLLLTLPVIAVCAVIIKRCDPGPVFYTQWRVGRDGWLFKIYKLRTMYLNAERRSGAVFADANDGRILPCGRWMRRSHIDELPQLWNILRGEMSLVGPRPERPEMLEQIRHSLPRFERRLHVKPGLTGLAQLRNGYANNAHGHRRKLAYDLRYIRRMNVLTDLRLLVMTLFKLWDRNAC